MSARIALLSIATEDGSTYFNIQWRANSASAWTDFYTTGSTLEDLAVGLLSSGVYSLDGVNSPTGNEAAASAGGNEYRYRLKSSGGYGNWSDPFKALNEPDTYGPLADGAELLSDFLDLQVACDFPSQEETDAWLGRNLTDAMDLMRLHASIDALYESDSRTAAQTRQLAAIERRYAMVAGLKKAARMKALGMHAPLLVEDAENILAVAEDLKAEADGMLAAVLSNSGSTANTPFALPAVSAGTFSVSTSDRTPSARNSLTDERDDIPSWDTENG